MPIIAKPLQEKITLTQRMEQHKPRRVLLLFHHGVGDMVMFRAPLAALRARYPGVRFDLATAPGLTYEAVWPECVPITNDDPNDNPVMGTYDLIAHIDFPMSEHQTALTKAEYCCELELGIEPTAGHLPLAIQPNKLVAVHFQITSLPGSANPDEGTAAQVWGEIQEAGYLPLECHFKHTFHNPVNERFACVDAHVRNCKADLRNLVSLIQTAGAFVGVVSGPYHVAIACLPPERVLLLEKDLKKECFTRAPHARVPINPYTPGEVKRWLLTL